MTGEKKFIPSQMGTLQQQSVLRGRSCSSRADEIFVHKILRSVATKFPKRAAILYDGNLLLTPKKTK